MRDTQVHEQSYQLLREAISKAENAGHNGMYLTHYNDGTAHLVKPNQRLVTLEQYDFLALSMDIQLSNGTCQHMELKDFIANKLALFLFNAGYDPKAQGMARLLPQKPGAFQVFSLRHGITKPILLSASPDCSLDLTAIGIANQKTQDVFGLRAMFPNNHTYPGIVALTTCHEIVSLWYCEKLSAADSHTSLEDVNEPNLLSSYYWGENYEA